MKFDTWFVAQFGKCPMSEAKALKLECDLKSAEMEVSRMRSELRAYRDWHFNETAARYAWNVKLMGGKNGNTVL